MAAAGRRVLVTGAAGQLAGRLLERLEADERVDHIVGVDTRDIHHPLARTEHIRLDLRNAAIARVVRATGVDTVVHLGLTALPRRAGGRSRMKELNVIGTMQLLAAVGKADRVRKVVLKSSTAVYGSSHTDPALFREDAEPGTPRSGYSADAVQVEGYARAFGRRRRDVTVSVLRFANVVGPTVDSPLTHYLLLPVVPTVMGYDPRVQLCHESDAAEVLTRAVLEQHPGTYNVAGPGILYLSQAVRLLGRPSVPVAPPLLSGLADVVRRWGALDYPPDQLHWLMFGRVGDISRLRRDFGFAPRWSTRRTLIEFARSRGVRPVIDPAAVAQLEQGLLAAATRVRSLLSVSTMGPS